MIRWITKHRLKKIADNDANGIYGEFLIQRQIKLEDITVENIDFHPSDWMKSLVSNYKNSVEQFVNKRNDIVKLYDKIRRYYAEYSETKKEFNDKKSDILSDIADIDLEITGLEKNITDLSKLLSDFHMGKSLPSGLTSYKLKSSKAKYEEELCQKRAQKKSLSNISSMQKENNIRMKEYRDKVKQVEYEFNKKVDLLYKRIHKMEIKYNEQISYYWMKLCEYIQYVYFEDDKLIVKYKEFIQITEPVKRIKDIALFCGTALPSKNDLFKSERTFINTTINQDMGIEYDV